MPPFTVHFRAQTVSSDIFKPIVVGPFSSMRNSVAYCREVVLDIVARGFGAIGRICEMNKNEK